MGHSEQTKTASAGSRDVKAKSVRPGVFSAMNFGFHPPSSKAGQLTQTSSTNALGSFRNVRGLRAFLPLHDFEFYCVAFLKAFVAL